MLYGILIGVGATLLIGMMAWQFQTICQLREKIRRMEKSMRKRLPYDGEKYAENTAAALVLLRHELEIKLTEVDNAIAWNSKLLNLGIKPDKEMEEE